MIDAIQNILVPPGQPPIDTERAIHIATNSAPIAGHYFCKFDDIQKREAYNNHPPIKAALPKVCAKFKKRGEQTILNCISMIPMGIHLWPVHCTNHLCD
jgi:hypothetical protein